MNTELTKIEKSILLGAVGDLARLLGMRKRPAYNEYQLQYELACAREDRIVVLNAARWTGLELKKSSERMAVTRCYRSLEKRGLIECLQLSWSESRVSHLHPTKKGIALVAALRKEVDEGKKTRTRKKSTDAAEIDGRSGDG